MPVIAKENKIAGVLKKDRKWKYTHIFQNYRNNKLPTHKENCLLYTGGKKIILTGACSHHCDSIFHCHDFLIPTKQPFLSSIYDLLEAQRIQFVMVMDIFSGKTPHISSQIYFRYMELAGQ